MVDSRSEIFTAGLNMHELCIPFPDIVLVVNGFDWIVISQVDNLLLAPQIKSHLSCRSVSALSHVLVLFEAPD